MMYWHGVDLKWAYSELLPSIYRQTFCIHAAYDVLHDALIRFALTKNHNRLEQPHAYLRTISQNLVLEKYRKDTHIQDYQNAMQEAEMTSPSAEHLADLNQRLVLLNQIIQDLPMRCREVFVLFRIEEISQKEIAKQLNISLNMVERHIIRALLDIRAAKQLLIS